VLERHGVKQSELDWVELNEAFAAQAVAVMNELDLDPDKVNPNGGAIALVHPLGMTGARLLQTATVELHEKENAKYALCTLCVGVGQGMSVILERV
jgi:acetyl-CoA C-acetyltransferase